MTLNGVNSYSSSIYGSSSAAVSGLVQFASSSKTEGNAGTPARMPSRFDAANQEAAQAKLESVNPDLAKKMEAFHQQVDQMRDSGASREDIQKAMQSNMESLTSSEKADLQSVFGGQGKGEMHKAHGHRHGKPAGPPPEGSSSDSSTGSTGSYAQSQASTLYSQAQSLLEQVQSEDSLAYSA